MADDFSTQRILGIHADQVRAKEAAMRSAAARYAIIQEAKADSFQEWSDTMNPLAIARRFETLETRIRKKDKEEATEKTEKKDPEEIGVEKLEEISQEFEKKNPELHSRNLLLLRARISSSDSPEDILRKVLEAYPDVSLADEALDFLMRTSDRALAEKILACKQRFNELYAREIRAGKNIAIHAREFSTKGLGSPTGLRDLYRDITGNPRDPTTLFNELAAGYPFDKMKTIIAFILHSLGSDLKSKGPSIAPGELHRLVSEARTLQAILGVYRFFHSRMKLILSSFDREGLALSTRISFELLARLFVKLIMERYPSSEKVLQLGTQMGLSDEIIAEVIIFTQMRDAVRQVAPKLFRNDQHRQDVLMTFIEALEDLEEQMEEDEGKEAKDA